MTCCEATQCNVIPRDATQHIIKHETTYNNIIEHDMQNTSLDPIILEPDCDADAEAMSNNLFVTQCNEIRCSSMI